MLLALEGLDPLGSDSGTSADLLRSGRPGREPYLEPEERLATGCCKAGEFREIPGGLTELGREAVQKMEELGMWLDVSHLNNDGFSEICACAGRPFIASHSDAWGIHPNYPEPEGWPNRGAGGPRRRHRGERLRAAGRHRAGGFRKGQMLGRPEKQKKRDSRPLPCAAPGKPPFRSLPAMWSIWWKRPGRPMWAWAWISAVGFRRPRPGSGFRRTATISWPITGASEGLRPYYCPGA